MASIDQYKCVDLFPYDIQDVNAFYHRNHPAYIPQTPEWQHYWAEQWRHVIEGRWIKDKDTWVYMMPKLYYYINFGTIELQGKAAGHRPLGPPKLRDNEWIIFTYLFCCQGFSGFEKDNAYTCNTTVRDILDEDSDVTLDNAEYLTDECFIDNDRNRPLKEYVNAWYYLTQHYLIDRKPEKPLGRPLYQNEVSNCMIFSARTLGKTFTMACGDLNHEWITGGVKYVEDLVDREGKNQLDRVKIEMFVGASTSKFLTNFMSKARTSYENMPGKFNSYGRSEQSPLFRPYTGNWLNTNTPTIQEYITADGGRGGSESKITKAVVSTGTEEIAVGQRPVRIYVDEVGLLEHAKRFHFANDNALKVDRKHGMACYSGCVCAGSRVWNNKGELVNIESLSQQEGILGYCDKEHVVKKQQISWMQPPTKKQCYRITLNSGRQIECSDDHPIYTRERYGEPHRKPKRKAIWKRADSLMLQEQVGIVDEVDVWSDRDMTDPYLMGIMIADGTYGKTTTKYEKKDGSFSEYVQYQNPMLTSADDEVWQHIDAKYVTASNHEEQETKDGRVLRKRRVLGVRQMFRDVGIYGQSKLNKRLPSDIQSYSKKSVVEFIAGLYDGDGCIHFNDKTKYRTIKYTSICKEIVYDLQLLLNKLGIHGRIQEERHNLESDLAKGKSLAYSLYVKDRLSCLRFSELIPVKIGRKAENLEKIRQVCIESNKKNKDVNYPGLRWERVVKIENIGLQNVYNLTAEGTNTYIVNGIQTHNTSGNLEKVQDVKEMFLNPLRYDIFPIPNYWENESKHIGLFIPYYYAKTEWKDENGNTDPAKGISAIVKIRKTKGIDGSDGAINILNEPIKPSEMFISEGENLFPQDRIIKRIEMLEAGLWEKKAQTGELELLPDKKSVRFQPIDGKPIKSFEFKKNQEKGVCVFYEHPRDDTPDPRYQGALYKIVYDPVSEEKGGTSMASIIVYKSLPKPYRAGEMYNTIVAEWIGRRHSLEEMHEIAIKFALYYKAKILFEANVSGVAVYFRATNRTHLLQPAPWAAQETVLKGKPKRNYTYGQRMTKEHKESCIKDLNQWAREIYSVGEEGETYTNIDRVYSLRLLHEMNLYNTYDNFDHISAFLLMMMWLRQEGRVEVMMEESKEAAKDYKELYDFVHTKHYAHEFNPLLDY